MKKRGYYEYTQDIYPRELWVHIGKDLESLIDDEFCDIELEDGKEYDGVTFGEAVRKNDGKLGVLVSFKSVKDMTMSVCAHEASHACDAIEDAIGMEHGGEASAYLIGYIASCINKARLGIGKFIEVDKQRG